MTADELIQHPSVQREFKIFRKLGGSIQIDGNKITLFPKILPIEIARVFAQRIKKLDEEKRIEVEVQI